ncbi:MAG: hypothetical protein NTW59_01835 [Candidatus Diapherotrites archaeon]|nr:hypothetical protein [Candidatus Diapherotrites archaeon]
MAKTVNATPKKKEKPARKVPRKTKRPKRRYILFELAGGSAVSPKEAFDIVMGACRSALGLETLKKEGIWFIEFNPQSGKGIVRCSHKTAAVVREAIEAVPAKNSGFSAKTLATGGTLRRLKPKLSDGGK